MREQRPQGCGRLMHNEQGSAGESCENSLGVMGAAWGMEAFAKKPFLHTLIMGDPLRSTTHTSSRCLRLWALTGFPQGTGHLCLMIEKQQRSPGISSDACVLGCPGKHMGLREGIAPMHLVLAAPQPGAMECVGTTAAAIPWRMRSSLVDPPSNDKSLCHGQKGQATLQ